MTNSPAGVLALIVYVGWVAGSGPLALAVSGLARWLDSVALAIRYVGAVVVGAVLAGTTALALFVDPVAGGTFAALALAAGVVLAAFPLYIGRQLLERWTTLPPDRALVFVVLGWPVALLASLAVFLAPGGPTRYNITVLSGGVAALAWTAMGLVATLGPGVVGFALSGLVGRAD
ncbi:MAG: hypothetical protein ABEI80_04360 [Haloplanus sp.]